MKISVFGVVVSNCLKIERSSAYFVSVKFVLVRAALTSEKKNVPEARPENRALKYHVRKSEGAREGAVDKDGSCAGSKITS